MMSGLNKSNPVEIEPNKDEEVRVRKALASQKRYTRSDTAVNYTSLAELCSDLKLSVMRTSGHNYNCLANATFGGAGRFDPSVPLGDRECVRASDEARAAIYAELKCHLPIESDAPSDSWHGGLSHAEAKRIHKDKGFMKEAHMSAAATLLARSIVVYDDRANGQPGVLGLFSPGYTPFKIITREQAKALAEDLNDNTLWVHLGLPGPHYSMLKRE